MQISDIAPLLLNCTVCSEHHCCHNMRLLVQVEEEVAVQSSELAVVRTQMKSAGIEIYELKR